MIPRTRSFIEFLNDLVGFETETIVYVAFLVLVLGFVTVVLLKIGGAF